MARRSTPAKKGAACAGLRGLFGLEIHWAVLDLQDHVVVELPVQRHESVEGLQGQILSPNLADAVSASYTMALF